MRKKNTETKTDQANKSASFRLPKNLLDKLADAASDQERSQTTLVRRALEAYLQKEGKKAD